MPNESPSIAAVVVTYNRRDLLRECLEHILDQTHPVSELVVVDNASQDGTVDMLTADFPQVTVLRMERNLGASGGFETGAKYAYSKGHEWIWLMDDDVMPDNGALKALLDASFEIGEVGFLCSRVIGIDGQSMNVPAVDDRPGPNGYGQWDRLLASGIVKVKVATFVSLLVHRKAVETVGFPIGEFFMWCDDTEFTSRISQHLASYVVGGSTVIHKRSMQRPLSILEESNPDRIGRFYYMYRNTSYHLRQNRGWFSFVWFWIRGWYTLLRCFQCRENRRARIYSIAKGLIAGLFFNPEIERALGSDSYSNDGFS